MAEPSSLVPDDEDEEDEEEEEETPMVLFQKESRSEGCFPSLTSSLHACCQFSNMSINCRCSVRVQAEMRVFRPLSSESNEEEPMPKEEEEEEDELVVKSELAFTPTEASFSLLARHTTQDWRLSACNSRIRACME